jgi:hypothetical protein
VSWGTNVDIEGVKAELDRFVAEVVPKNGSGNGYITTQSYATCGRPRAIELSERVRPILDVLYSEWRTENPEDDTFEFSPERDASMRLLSRIASRAEVDALLGGMDASPRLAASAMHPLVWGAASAQWSTGHRHEAVLAGAKAVNSLMQTKVGRRDVSEAKLVREALSDRPPEAGRTRLRFRNIADEQTQESMRRGVMEFGAGCFQAIRNPIGHLPNAELELGEQEALERLAALSLLARWVDDADLETF